MKIRLTGCSPESEISDNAKICYATSGDKDITKTLVHGHGHLAALRFAYATFRIEDISVACQNQIVRSSHLSYMVQSKRYVNPKKGDFKFIMPNDLNESQEKIMRNQWNTSMNYYLSLISQGVKKEDARAVLPANTSTNMNVTGNLQGWWDFFVLRLNTHAQQEIREVAIRIYTELSIVFPQVFNDKVFEGLTK